MLFLYRHVLGREVGELARRSRARKPKRLPVVMTREEVKAVIESSREGDKWPMVNLMYCRGLATMECLRLREFVFPQEKRWIDVRTSQQGRHHIDDRLQKAVRSAICKAGITKHASCHTFRHSFATHLLDYADHIRTSSGTLGSQRMLQVLMIWILDVLTGAGKESAAQLILCEARYTENHIRLWKMSKNRMLGHIDMIVIAPGLS